MKVTAVVAERRAGTGESTAAALKLQEVELADELRGKEVLVRVVACGVCRADLDCVDQKSPFPLPAVLGHEGTGVVERVGARVEKVKPGDHVIMAFPNDGTCPSCLDGKPRQCVSGGTLMWGGKRYDGSESAWSRDGGALAGHMFQQSAFATHAIATEMNCVVVPDEVPLDTFVIGCGVMTGAGGVLNVLKPGPGSSIVVLGVGGVGSAAVMAAKLAGCGAIIAVDPKANRRDLAIEIGATHAIDPGTGDTAEQVKAITGGGADYVISCSPDDEAISHVLGLLKIGGVCGMIGDPGAGIEARFVVSELLGGSKSIVGINGGEAVAQTFLPILIAAHARGALPLEKVQRRYRLEDIGQAFADVESGDTIKPVIVIGDVAA